MVFTIALSLFGVKIRLTIYHQAGKALRLLVVMYSRSFGFVKKMSIRAVFNHHMWRLQRNTLEFLPLQVVLTSILARTKVCFKIFVT